MDKKNELPPACELANLPTCLLANLLTILTMLFHAHSVPPSSYPRPAGRYEGRGGFSHPLVSFAEPVFTHALRRFRKLILSAISPGRFIPRLAWRM